VVSERHGVKLEVVEGLGDLLRSIEGVEEGSLELVAGIEPEVVRVLLAEAIDGVLDASVAAIAALLGIDAVGARRGELVEMGVDIVDVEEGLSVSWVAIKVSIETYTCCSCHHHRQSA
jgi:hypothetical protein